MIQIRPARAFVLLSLVCFAVSACSVREFGVNILADTLSQTGTGSNAFMRDNDLLLVGDSLPFTIKLYEIILDQAPEHRDLILATGSLTAMFANAFVWAPAELLPGEYYLEQYAARYRAKALYLRARDLLFRGLDLKYPGASAKLLQGQEVDELLATFKEEDVPYLYWTAASWFGAFSLDNFDAKLSVGAVYAARLMARAYELDPEFDDRTIDEFYITFNAVAPEGFGANPAKVQQHFERVVELRGDQSIGPYLALAEAVAIPTQDFELFRDMVMKARAVPVKDYPDRLTINTLHSRKIEWLWENRENFFLETGE